MHVQRTIVCQDGFSLSVCAGRAAYSIPRNDVGPWEMLEVGFPSEIPQPWSDWAPYCEDPDQPCQTVYGYVPIEIVESLIAFHGGER